MTPREISRFETSLNVRNAWGLGLAEYIVETVIESLEILVGSALPVQCLLALEL